MESLLAVDLKKAFTLEDGTRLEVLRGVSLSIESGESLAIIGESGAGKSTLLALLAGLDEPDDGSVHVLGKDLSTMKLADRQTFRALKTSLVFQGFHLLSNLTAFENIALPLQIAGDSGWKEKAQKAIEEVGLKGRSGQFPHQLSGGEKQRVAIARALIVQPAVLFADEPSGNLDAKTGDAVTDLMFRLVKERGSSLVLITHSPALAQRCDRVFELKAGELFEVKKS